MRLLDRLDAFASPADLVLSLAETPISSGGVRDRSGVSVAGRDGSWYLDSHTGGPDFNPELAGRGKYEIFREMALSDPAVRSLEWLYKLPIRAAEWSVSPASEDPADVEVADCLAWQFGLAGPVDGRRYPVGRARQTWDDSLSGALTPTLRYGAHGEEIVWSEDVEVWRNANGDSRIVRPIERLAPRMAGTIWRVKVDERTGEIDWVEQDLPGARPIPGEKLAWYTIERDGATIWGTSLLRACYGAWLLKKGMMTATAIGWDRYSSGIPVVRYPKGSGSENKRRAEEIGKNWRHHERGWVTLEGAATDGWDVEIKGGNGTLADPTPLLRHYDEQIAKAGLQQFSSLGTTERGSRAVGDVLVEPYYLAVQGIADSIRLARMRYVFRRFVDVNFGPEYAVPDLRVSKIQGKNLSVLARILADLSAAGLSFSDIRTQNDIRDLLEFEHMEELPAPARDAISSLPDDVGLDVAPRLPSPGGAPREGDSIAA